MVKKQRKNLIIIFLYIILSILFFVFLLYLFSPFFRCFLTYYNIDPNFIIAFLTSSSIILSFINTKNSEKNIKIEREYQYDLDLNNKIKERVEFVIGKLFIIMNQSEIFFKTIENINKATTSNIYEDVNNVSSRDFIENNKEMIGAYITMYFAHHIAENWNKMNDKLGLLQTNCNNLLINYKNYIETGTSNKTIEMKEYTLEVSKQLNGDIFNLTQEMKNTLLGIIKENDSVIRKKYLNKII